MRKTRKSCKRKEQRPAQRVNETRSLKLMKNPFSFSKNQVSYKNTDVYCDLSISYTDDFPENPSVPLISNARSSLIDLRAEAKMYLDSSRRAATKRTRDSISQNESVLQNDQLTFLIQTMHESMQKIHKKLEKVTEKSFKRDQENEYLKNSIIELQEKIQQIQKNPSPKCCSGTCIVI